MKRCPNCDRTFDDAMRFCQSDGTQLVADEPVDPYKTMVARAEDLASARPGPGETGQAKDEDHVLDIPDRADPLKTMYASEDEIRRAMDEAGPADQEVMDIPPLAESAPPEPPKFSEPSLSPPSFGKPSSPFSSPGGGEEFGKTNPPIPSPFSDSPSPKLGSPSERPPPFAEPEPFGKPTSANPFDVPPAPRSQPMAQSEWNPPPAPEPAWQNQGIGQNTPFQPPPAGGGQNQTLAIVSLILGVVGLVLCAGLTSPIALVTGFLARRKAAQNPVEYGGAGLALAGIITGAIGSLILLLWVLYIVLVFGIVGASILGG